jgi:hypothetical protein
MLSLFQITQDKAMIDHRSLEHNLFLGQADARSIVEGFDYDGMHSVNQGFTIIVILIVVISLCFPLGWTSQQR